MRSLYRVLPALLLLVLFLPLPGAAAPAGQAQPEMGAVTAVGLDAAGNGWALALSAGAGGTTSFLIRVENGAWRVVADRSSNPALLAEDLFMQRMVLTADGADGWAIGQDVHLQQPVLWRLQGGAWSRVQLDLPGNSRLLTSIAIAEEGRDGWLTVYNPAHAATYLLRLRGDGWSRVELPEDTALEYVSISPNGRHGWATGYQGGEPRVFGLKDGQWTFVPGAFLPPDGRLTAVAASNDGAGWAAAVDAAPGARMHLIRLRPDVPPGTVLQVAPPAGYEQKPEVEPYLSNIVLDRMGRGWAAGSFQLEIKNRQPLEYGYHLALVRLSGDEAVAVPGSSAGAIEDNISPVSLATAYDGGRAWLGGRGEKLGGLLLEMREPWRHQEPAQAAPLPGEARCFAEVPFCLRGIFASYWEQNGGLERFGYPIAVEVTETHDGRRYRVQYTQRARFEEHPEHRGTPHEVLLGLLGNSLVDPRLEEAPFRPVEPAGCPGCRWFPETGHNVVPPLLTYWQAGGVAVFGLPRSEAFDERSLADGKLYRVQYFERNRIEHHPENSGTRHEFLLGLLGVEQFMASYGYVP